MTDNPSPEITLDLETLQEVWAQQVASLVTQVALLRAQNAAQAALLDTMVDRPSEDAP